MVKKRSIAFALLIVAICSLVGCGSKEDTKTEKGNNQNGCFRLGVWYRGGKQGRIPPTATLW